MMKALMQVSISFLRVHCGRSRGFVLCLGKGLLLGNFDYLIDGFGQ